MIALAAVGAGLWFLALPLIVERAVGRALSDAGFRDVRVRVVSLSTSRAEFADVALGRGAPLRAGRVHVAFALREAMRGRMREIVVDDLTWDPCASEASSAIAPFDELVDGSQDETGATPAAEPLPDLRVARIELRRCRVRLPTQGEVLEFEGDALLEMDAEAWRAKLSARGGGEVLEAGAALRREGKAASGDVSVRFGAAEAPLELKGTARITAAGGGGTFAVDMRGEAPQLQTTAIGYGITGRGISVEVGARATPSTGGPTLVAWSASIRTTETGELALAGERWPPIVRGLTLVGSLRASGEVVAGNSRPASTQIEVEDVLLRSPDGWSVEGLQATALVLGLRSPTTPSGQGVRWRSVRFGDLRTLAGTLSFRLLEGSVLRVESAGWSIDEEGSMAVSAFELDPKSAEILTVLSLGAVRLEDWLDLVGRKRVTGSGRISGQIAARVRFSPQLDVDLGEGRLRAIGGGTVRFLDDPETLRLLEDHVAVSAASGAGEYQDLVKQRIVDSLKDFAYDQLTFDLVTQDGHVTLRTHVVGKGRTVPQGLDLNVNLNGFDELVEVALDLKLGVDNAKRRMERALAPPELKRRSQ